MPIMEKDSFKSPLVPALPADVFRYRFIWKIYETIKNYPWVTSQLVLYMSFLFVVEPCVEISELFIGVYLTGMFLSMIYILFLLRYICRDDSKPFSNVELLRDTVLAVDPGVDARKWDIVTSKVNYVLYDNGYRRTPYYFFNRSHCWSVSHHYILRFDSEAAERYRQAVNKCFDDFLQDKPYGCGSKLGRELNVKLASDRGFTIPTFICIISFSFSLLSMNDSRKRLKWFTNINKVGLFVFFCVTFVSIYKGRGMVKYKALGVLHRIKFLATAMQHAPGNDLEKWDHIARHMNYYLHEKGVWRRPEENFFDGKECLDFYRSQFEPLASASTKLFYVELRDIVQETNKVCGSPVVGLV
ncbi:ZYRO0D00352p [Zygosaccharomyces rouxii]|uniref:ZYRO0D00352p n=1 Tax=Zygosaccharomyces rouxii (strain ATCC 2623 / CBS 732 / NBRC 1130 / NCYC 568 / NRRL Y-229) TaxID=559307 RepID=C5DWW6_ZYGRC|nr:uncharacterized protein ZYRO0D00352g [Zygosaccharomyces rouxii]KAH9200435.1 DUP family-domain-containing protein [Zygosaccharomyces rouxii]CAR27517.1 ZYRO0D00352p [Zygosaccharomyces rouxii]